MGGFEMNVSPLLKTLVSCRARYALPGDPTKDLYLLPVSGGGDSAALAILLHAMFPEIPFRMVFTDTLAEEPEIYDVLDRLERYVGRKIERIVPEKGLFEIVDDYNGYLPSPQARWCTRMLKLVPFREWIDQFRGVQKHMFVGIRAEEDRIAFALEEVNTEMPFVDMGMRREDVFQILSETIGIPKFYARRTRSGCATCPFQRRSELVGLLQERPIEFRQGEQYEKLHAADAARWGDAQPFWKDTAQNGIAATWQTLPLPEAGEIQGKRAARAPDLFGSRIYVGGEFFVDGWMLGDEFIWHQRLVSVAPTLHSIKQQLDDRYHHLLATAEVYGLTPEDVKAQARFAIWVIELPAEVFDPEGPRHDSYTWQQGWAYKQLRHVVEWATRALHAEGQRQIAARPVRSELSIQAEWRDGAQTSLAGVTAPIGSVIASQWHQPSEKPRELTEDEAVRFMACPACSL